MPHETIKLSQDPSQHEICLVADEAGLCDLVLVLSSFGSLRKL